MKLLIVDDEPIVRETMLDILPWSNLGFEEVLSARDAYEAQKVLNTQTVDLMICDVEMPGMDGLALAEWLHQQAFKTVTIFLTCHASFAYAQCAIRYGVVEYLLKPVTPEALRRSIQGAVNRILEHQRKAGSVHDTVQWQKLQNVATETFWHDVLICHLGDENLLTQRANDLCVDLELRETFSPILFLFGKTDLQAKTAMLKEALEEDAHLCTWVTLDEARVVGVFPGEVLVSKRNFDKRIKDNKILKDALLRCVVGPAVPAVEISRVVCQLRSMAEDCIADDYTFLSWIQNVQERIPEKLELPPLEEWLRQDKLSDVFCQKVTAWLDREDVKSGMQKKDLIHFQNHFEQTLFTYLQKKNIDSCELLNNEALQALKSQASQRMGTLLNYLRRFVTEAERLIQIQYEGNPIVTQIKQHIIENYAQPLARKDLAAMVYLNPDYMDRLFKEQQGMSVNRYLNHVRMEKAKHLLETTQLQVLEIANLVGYTNLSNFNVQFKQHCHMSPKEYRKLTQNK